MYAAQYPWTTYILSFTLQTIWLSLFGQMELESCLYCGRLLVSSGRSFISCRAVVWTGRSGFIFLPLQMHMKCQWAFSKTYVLSYTCPIKWSLLNLRVPWKVCVVWSQTSHISVLKQNWVGSISQGSLNFLACKKTLPSYMCLLPTLHAHVAFMHGSFQLLFSCSVVSVTE